MLSMNTDWTGAITGFAEHQLAMGILESTVALRALHLRKVAREVGGDPWGVTGATLVAWVQERPWSAETRRSYRSTLRTFYRWAAEEALVERSPARALPRVLPAPPRPRPVPDPVYRAAYAAAPRRVRLMMRLAADAGLRRGEVAQVHSRDLLADLDGWSLLVHGKGGRERVVPLTPRLAIELRALPAGWAFPGQIRGHLSPARVGELVSAVLPDGWTMHKLRHRAASAWWEASDGDVYLVQELLGHTDPKTTKIYVRINAGRFRAVVEAAAA